jgi:protein O-GlcNAc transferase
MATVSETFAVALQYHQAGNLRQAEELYQRILQADPRQADCYHLLGVLAYQTGRYDLAVRMIRQALALNPLAAPFLVNLGMALEALGQSEEAVANYEQALRFEPENAAAHCNLANCRLRRGKLEEAVRHYTYALAVNCHYAEAHCGLGVALGDLGKLDEAVEHLHQALAINPRYAEAHNNLGKTLLSQGKEDEAMAQWQEALRLRPAFPEVLYNIGNTFLEQHKVDEATASYREALRYNPNLAHAHHGLGNALERQDKLDEAIDCYRQALRLNPNLAQTYNNLANTLTRQFKIEEAIPCYQEALRLMPNYAEAHYNFGNAFAKRGCPEEALAKYREALAIQPDLAKAQSNVLFCLNYHPDADPDQVFQEHCRWGREQLAVARDRGTGVRGQESGVRGQESDKQPRAGTSTPTDTDNWQLTTDNKPDSERRLRVGYISPDLRFHPLTRYIEPVLAHHDPAQVEVFCYAEVAQPDAVTHRLQQLAPAWRSTYRLTNSQVADRIRQDRIDILVDLAGHTAENRLGVLAYKPTPIQVTWLGYMNTTGLTTVDYRLTDEVLDPKSGVRCPVSGVKSVSSDSGRRTPDSGRVFDTEELYRLPSGMCCFAPPADAPDVSQLPALRRGYLTFGSLNGPFKLNSRVFDLWSRVLHALPTARLLMFHDFVVGTGQDRLHRIFAERGIGADRLDLRKGSCTPGYLGVYSEIDVSLDPFPCTGGVTTCESLWMGVPVVSLCGVRPAGRNSAALLSRVGLNEWAVDTQEEYVALAASLAGKLDELAKLRAELRDQMQKTLCDARRFTRELEDAYRNMWRRWCNKVAADERG